MDRSRHIAPMSKLPQKVPPFFTPKIHPFPSSKNTPRFKPVGAAHSYGEHQQFFSSVDMLMADTVGTGRYTRSTLQIK